MQINRLKVKLVLKCLLFLAVITGLVVQVHARAKLKTYKTKYYIIHTDLDTDGVQEAVVRMTAMADEYRRRTRGFSGKLRKRLPFYLFRNSKDYYAFGGLKGSAGVFMGGALMAIAGEKTSEQTWHIVQHEGFHQFAHATIGRDLPIWADEGMAEYFGQAIFTGDGFVVGVIPPRRLARLKKEIKENKIKSFSKMMTMTNRQWIKEMAPVNYDQAWSMIYFLIRAENGKYQKATTGFLKDISRGRPYLDAWTRNFGPKIKIFEKRWREYWLALPKNPTADLYDKAVAATLTSFFARAYSQRQKFKNADEFFQTARAGKLKAHKKDWLPPSLLTNALDKAGKTGKWSIKATKGRPPKLICIRDDGKQFVGAFLLKSGRVSKVNVEIVEKKETRETEKN